MAAVTSLSLSNGVITWCFNNKETHKSNLQCFETCGQADPPHIKYNHSPLIAQSFLKSTLAFL